MRYRTLWLLLWAAALIAGPGCSSLTKNKGSKKDSPWEAMQFWKKGYQQPQKMAVLWSYDILTVGGKPPTRGFGGRLYFYNNKSQTIPVEGELIVHGFDETAKRAAGLPESEPDKRFRFTAEQFTEHFSESDLGASYSVWIPWDAAEGVQKEITLIPTFRSSKGEVVQGTAAKVVLPGRASPENNFAPPVQTVAYVQSQQPTVGGSLPQFGQAALGPAPLGQAPVDKKPQGMRTTTIQLPPAHGRRAAVSPSRQAGGSPAAALTAPPQHGAATSLSGTALDEARAQIVHDAFKSATPVAHQPTQSLNAQTTNNAPMQSAAAVNNNSFMPLKWADRSFAMQPGGTNAPVMPSTQTAVQPAAASEPSATELGLPPGVQLSPRATAW